MFGIVIILFGFLAGPASADLFTAAGRIEDENGRAICSASMIGPDIIVTAAHCVSERSERSLHFRLGTTQGIDPIPVKQIERHPLYDGFDRFRRLRFDVAVGVLTAEISISHAKQFDLGENAVIGEGLYIISWPRGSGERPRQRRCVVIEGEIQGVVTLGCRVRGGESGAPLVRLTDEGVELVAIINSTAKQNGQSVALASDVRLRIPPLLDALQATP